MMNKRIPNSDNQPIYLLEYLTKCCQHESSQLFVSHRVCMMGLRFNDVSALPVISSTSFPC